MTPNFYIGLSQPAEWKVGAELIKWAENFEASHCYLKIPIRPDRVVYIHANMYRVNILGQDMFLEYHNPLYEKGFLATEGQFGAILDYIYDNMGKDYGFLPVLGILIKRIFRMKKNPFADGLETIHCTELCDNVLEIIGHGRNYDAESDGVKDFFNAYQGWKKL